MLISILSVGCVIGVVLFFLFLRARKKISQLSLYKKILDHVPTELAVLDQEGRHVYINHYAIKNPELRKWMIGKTPVEYCVHRNKPIEIGYKRLESIKEIFRKKEITEWEEEFATPNGKLHYMRRMAPILSSNGDMSFATTYGLNITKQKEAEQLLKEKESVQQAIIYFANSLFKQNTEEDILWDITLNCIHQLGFVDCVIYLIDESRNILIQKAAYGQKDGGDYNIVAPIEIPLGKGIVGNVARSRQAEIIGDTSQDPRYIIDDDMRYSELAVPIISPEGQVIGVIDSEHPDKHFFTDLHLDVLAVISSICATKLIKAKADQAMMLAKEAAESASRAKAQFLSTMSHEIRTPLNAVIGLSHLLLNESPQASQLENLNTLHFSANHLLALVNDILDYSKLESGKFTFEKREFDLLQFCKNIHQTFQFQAKNKQIGFHCISPPLSNHVLGDEVRLNQILTNLIGNALKFTADGQVEFGYAIDQEDQQQMRIRFHVKDTGIGISEENQSNIFSQFVQESASIHRQFGGTGLGLTICKKLVELQGGTIGVTSQANEGAEFWFHLEFEKGHPHQRSLKERKNQQDWKKQRLPKMKVLLVEDNKVNQMIGKKYLKRWQIDTDLAENGEIAIEKVSQTHYDLVLMDLNMPKMGGLEATRLIRDMEEPHAQNLPIIALTADVSAHVREEAFHSGMTDFLTKPFDPNALFEMLKTFYPITV